MATHPELYEPLAVEPLALDANCGCRRPGQGTGGAVGPRFVEEAHTEIEECEVKHKILIGYFVSSHTLETVCKSFWLILHDKLNEILIGADVPQLIIFPPGFYRPGLRTQKSQTDSTCSQKSCPTSAKASTSNPPSGFMQNSEKFQLLQE